MDVSDSDEGEHTYTQPIQQKVSFYFFIFFNCTHTRKKNYI